MLKARPQSALPHFLGSKGSHFGRSGHFCFQQLCLRAMLLISSEVGRIALRAIALRLAVVEAAASLMVIAHLGASCLLQKKRVAFFGGTIAGSKGGHFFQNGHLRSQRAWQDWLWRWQAGPTALCTCSQCPSSVKDHVTLRSSMEQRHCPLTQFGSLTPQS